ncbi:hypothetical protein Aeqsu_1851 [Aequorivita sublithincola DSM 14238]|uniref:DUF3857 domain-containing protein n=1 Tax=Aequorivita sublithincola (strain DSM 14238 / LMG 21431 / ACAM 643 / 9-3) TaxID=746697 RepID=I3YWF9_AEQSU|nr:DUF3857 domain-containing protein [Aequorivita sublithincola]AFL81327.1 hypothetical protein Aeqsu_1851 [Aequorivita sublithincola DSM 14238]
MTRIICFALLLCSAHLFSQKDYSLAAVNLELKDYSNSILIDELVEVDVTDINKLKTKTRRVLAVLNKMGDGDANLYEYYDTNSRVKNVEVWIYNALGKEMEHFKKKDFVDVSRTGNNMYVDSRALYLNYTPTTYPYIVVFESETETGDSAFISPWYPLGGYAESTQKSIFKIKFDPANKPKYKSKNLDGYDISISETPEEITFSANNLKAIRYEEHSPSRDNILPNITVALNLFKLKGTSGSGTDWHEFGSWMNKSLLTDVNELPEGTIARVKSLVAHETTNEGKARKIYQFVQDKVRYISIQIGIGGWKPMLATDVDKLSYGDCKALTNYTKSLLDIVGVPSYYTVLYGGSSERDIISDFTSLQGNHVILGIPDGDEITWLECTSQDTPYGYIGDFTDDRDVLIMTPEGGKIAHTKIYKTEESTQKNTIKAMVDAQGNVTAAFESISEGLQYDDKYLLPKKKQDDVDEFYKNRWSYINGFSLSNFEFNNDRENIIFTEKVGVIIPKYANPVGKDFLFCANIFNQSRHIPPRIESRKQNLYLDYGYVDFDTVEVEIPENFSVETLPEPTVLETKFGKYEIAFSKISENKLTYTRKLRMDKGEYPPEEYENFRDFLRSIARLDKTKILLKQNLQ